MKLDRFDLLTISAALALITSAAGLAVFGAAAPAPARVASAHAQAVTLDPSIEAKLSSARALFGSGRMKEAVSTLDAIVREHPSEPEAHALLGQAYSALQDYPRAMREYGEALRMDPEYVDKKSEKKFIGKRIKAAVKEGMADAKARLDKDKDDASARAALKDAYYLERMLAGGCE